MNNWNQISIEFQLSTEDEIIDGATVESPFVIRKDQASRFPGFLLERLVGLGSGERFYYEIDPELAFGRINKDLIIELSKEKVPDSIRRLGVGDTVEMKDPDKKLRPFRVTQSDEQKIILDGNSVWAGQRLIFEGRVISSS